jgi:hypothetical protein
MSAPFKQLVADQPGQVVLKERHEVEYWTQHLGVRADLRAAIAAVGNAAHEVRKYLAGQRP